MRNLTSYLNRRNVRTQEEKDAWAAKNGIDSHAKLIQFCESKMLKCTGTWVFSVTVPPSQPSSPVEERVSEPPKTDDDATWHTPAALRPLKKSAPLPKKESKPRKRSTRKARSKKNTPIVDLSEE